jgi:hypothetical protein
MKITFNSLTEQLLKIEMPGRGVRIVEAIQKDEDNNDVVVKVRVPNKAHYIAKIPVQLQVDWYSTPTPHDKKVMAQYNEARKLAIAFERELPVPPKVNLQKRFDYWKQQHAYALIEGIGSRPEDCTYDFINK